MKLKSIIALVVLAVCCLPGHTQAQDNPNPWFIQGQLGMTYSTGSPNFGKLLSPGGQLAVGKYFSPVWGARIAIGGWQGRAASTLNSETAHSFYYGSATLDGMMNLSQLIKRYHERLFDVSIIAGIGFNRAFDTSVSSFMGRLGLQGSFRLNEALDFNVELLANGVSDRWNRLDDHGIDTYFTLGFGLTYKFGTGFKCASCLTEEYPEVLYTEDELNEIVNQQRAEVVEAETRNAAARMDTVYVEKDCPPAKVVKGIRSHVTFELGKTNITESQEMNIMAVVQYLEQYPEANATINGYADTGTGTPEINLRLAKQRAEAVRDCMVNKYGIDASRLSVMSMEGDEQPFKNNNDWNRVVIIVAD